MSFELENSVGFVCLFIFNMLSHSSIYHSFQVAQVQLLGPYVYYKTLSDCMRMTFLHRTTISWTLSLHKPFEGHIITEVGNFSRLSKDSESAYSASDRAQVLHTALECLSMFSVYSECQGLLLPPSSSQMVDAVSHAVRFPSTFTGPMSKNKYPTQLLCTVSAENSVLQTERLKNSTFSPDLL